MSSKADGTTTLTPSQTKELGPWGDAFATLEKWDPKWAETCLKMTTNPWTGGVLQLKLVELIGVALNSACTNLDADGLRRHIRAALRAGATRDEILLVLKMASLMSIESCMLAGPILLEESSEGDLDAAAVERLKRLKRVKEETPAIDEMKALGKWNVAWDPFFDLAPVWTDQFMATAIALDASYKHIYPAGTRRHIKKALKAGATVEEIMEVLKLCVVEGVQACNLGVPILEEELSVEASRNQ